MWFTHTPDCTMQCRVRIRHLCEPGWATWFTVCIMYVWMCLKELLGCRAKPTKKIWWWGRGWNVLCSLSAQRYLRIYWPLNVAGGGTPPPPPTGQSRHNYTPRTGPLVFLSVGNRSTDLTIGITIHPNSNKRLKTHNTWNQLRAFVKVESTSNCVVYSEQCTLYRTVYVHCTLYNIVYMDIILGTICKLPWDYSCAGLLEGDSMHGF